MKDTKLYSGSQYDSDDSMEFIQSFSQMKIKKIRKNTKISTTNRKQSKLSRPKNKDIQILFLKKLRGQKLNCITYESSLELYLSSFSNHVKFDKLFSYFPNESNFNLKELYTKLQTFKEQWQWKEVTNKQDLPQYLFSDGDDPSYLICQLKKEESIQNQNLPYILFSILLYVLNQKELLSKQIIQIFREMYQQIIQSINMALVEIRQNNISEQTFQIQQDQRTINTRKGKKKVDIVLLTVNYICWAYIYILKK